MRQILLATGNKHKLSEVRDILGPLGIHVLGGDDVGGIPDVVEDRDTFTGNAVKKALTIAELTGRIVLADDSGLEVMALHGAPGVYSARYAGEHGNSKANIVKLLRELDGVTDRRARFVCVMALAGPDGVLGTAEGEVRGHIIHEPRGDNGFGYDPVFMPGGCDRTFAQLAAVVKNGMSHRGNALQAALSAGLFDVVDDQTQERPATTT